MAADPDPETGATNSGKPPAAKPAGGENADVPVRAVVLFSSGVGYFEHFGTVKGDAATELRFKTAQINDILKSLVLQDMDGGKVSTITYPSQDPVEKTLRSFQVDITRNPPLADLLTQLRGAKVELSLGEVRKIAGTVLGVEKKTVVHRAGEGVMEEVFKVNLLTGSGANIKSVALAEVTDIAIQDPQLQNELKRALEALAQARDQEKKPVTINFAGKGERHVRVGYVVESPVWKTSYRLVLSTDAKTKPRLQGWAIIENQTDNDWTNVELSLVSGRPISFIQDLYRPLYIPRPVVRPELFASLTPQTYGPGVSGGKDGLARGYDVQDLNDKVPNFDSAPDMSLSRGGRGGAGGGGGGSSGGGGGLFGGGGGARPDATPPPANAQPEDKPIDPVASVTSAASAAQLGELFQYTVPNVSLARQRSAMIPIVTDDLEVERLSIYNIGVLAKHPLTGARVKNTTANDKHLPGGPVTVLVDSRYAGDARLENLPPRQERLLSYGIDLEVNVVPESRPTTTVIRTAKIARGVLELTLRTAYTQAYVIENKAKAGKTLLIEHAINAGGPDSTVAPKADEKTAEHYRFKVPVKAGEHKTFEVREEQTHDNAIALFNIEADQYDLYVKNGELPKEVRDAIAKAADLKRAAADLDRQVNDKQSELSRVPGDQQRIRENMKVIDRESGYYKDLLKKLQEQEAKIDAVQRELERLRAEASAAKQRLAEYLKGLSV
ncbi:MAG TPA: DUF4139 domain-containing protein [Tepidisphaeraceae bacterium]|nr:DUF4139 domain-containing protein [Tepidisphaeraceae bacterium]